MTILRRTILLTALSLANLLVLWSPDVLPTSLFAWTVLREGNVDYDEFTIGPNAIDRQAYFFRACGVSTFTGTPRVPRAVGGAPPPGPTDHVCSIFPPGAAIGALPFFAPLVIAGASPDQLALLLGVGKAAAALEEGLAAALLIATMARVASARWSIFLGLLYLLATAVRTTSSQALWQHGAEHVLDVLALFLLVPLFLGERPGRTRLLLAGAALGFAIVVRQTSALLAAWRSRDALAPLVRWLGAATLVLVLVYAAYAEWWGGRVFGARFLTDALPALFLTLAVAPPKRVWSRVAFAACAAWALLLHSAAAVAYAQTPGGGGVWDTERNVNFDPAPLFDWRDPQWLDTLRAAAHPDGRELAAVAL